MALQCNTRGTALQHTRHCTAMPRVPRKMDRLEPHFREENSASRGRQPHEAGLSRQPPATTCFDCVSKHVHITRVQMLRGIHQNGNLLKTLWLVNYKSWKTEIVNKQQSLLIRDTFVGGQPTQASRARPPLLSRKDTAT